MTARDRQHTIPQDHVAEDRVAAVRRFNRFYTRQLGVLRKTYLDSPYSLGEARLLYEIAQRRSPTASEIVCALDLDAGYLSRTLRNFEKRGLIQRKVSAHDTRQSHISLSASGRKAFAPLDRRSQRDAGATLEKLKPEEQARLVAAMNTIETLLDNQAEARPTKASVVKLRAPVPGDFDGGSAPQINLISTPGQLGDETRHRLWTQSEGRLHRFPHDSPSCRPPKTNLQNQDWAPWRSGLEAKVTTSRPAIPNRSLCLEEPDSEAPPCKLCITFRASRVDWTWEQDLRLAGGPSIPGSIQQAPERPTSFMANIQLPLWARVEHGADLAGCRFGY